MFGAATLVYGALVATSLVGGPLKPQQLLPFPELANNMPVLDPQPTAGPGAKNTPTANRPGAASAKKINNATTAPSGAASPAVAGVPGAVTTTTPAVGATTAAPQPSPSGTKPPATPQPTLPPIPSTTPTLTHLPAGNTEGTPGTALPGPSASGLLSQSVETVPVGEIWPAAATLIVQSAAAVVQSGAGAA